MGEEWHSKGEAANKMCITRPVIIVSYGNLILLKNTDSLQPQIILPGEKGTWAIYIPTDNTHCG